MAFSQSVALHLRQLWRCRRGVAAIQFALAAPILFLCLAGIIECGSILFAQTVLDGAVSDAARTGVTGNFSTPLGGGDPAVRIAQAVNQNSFGLMTVDAQAISVRTYANYADIGLAEPFTDNAPANGTYDAGEAFTDINGNGVWDADRGTSGDGGASAIVVYQVRADWPLMTGFMVSAFGGDRLGLTASLVVRNEPYPGS